MSIILNESTLINVLDFSGETHALVSRQFAAADKILQKVVQSRSNLHRSNTPNLAPVLTEASTLQDITNFAAKVVPSRTLEDLKRLGTRSMKYVQSLDIAIENENEYALLVLGRQLVEEGGENLSRADLTLFFDSPENLRVIREIEECGLTYKKLRVIPKELGLFQSLKCLDLCNNDIETIEHFPPLPQLSSLYLRSNNITLTLDELPGFVKKLKKKYPKLMSLELQNNTIPSKFTLIAGVMVNT